MIETCVTGASGFIGRHLVDKLINDVVVVSHGQMAYDNTKNLFFLSTYGNMAHHLNHFEMIKANVNDVIWWLDNGLVKEWFCYMSSSSVTLPVQTPYSRTKRAAEEILQALPELKSCIVRPYSVTGVGEQKEHLIPTLIRSCMEGEEMPFDPYPVHDFVDVEDVVYGLIRLADAQETGIHEFGRGMAISNQSVREMVEQICGKKANAKFSAKLRDYDSGNWVCNNQSRLFRHTKAIWQSIHEMVEAYKREQA